MSDEDLRALERALEADPMDTPTWERLQQARRKLDRCTVCGATEEESPRCYPDTPEIKHDACYECMTHICHQVTKLIDLPAFQEAFRKGLYSEAEQAQSSGGGDVRRTPELSTTPSEGGGEGLAQGTTAPLDGDRGTS